MYVHIIMCANNVVQYKMHVAELSPVKRPPMNKTRPTSNTNRNPVRHTQGTVKSSIQGTVKSSVQGTYICTMHM